MNVVTALYRLNGLPLGTPEHQRSAWARHVAGETVILALLPKNGDHCTEETMGGGCGYPLLIDGSCVNVASHRDVVEAALDEDPEVTDAMVTAADDALQDAGVCSHDVSPADIRLALIAALRAQREHRALSAIRASRHRQSLRAGSLDALPEGADPRPATPYGEAPLTWRPMNEAPRDGTDVMVRWPDGGDLDEPDRAFWSQAGYCWYLRGGTGTFQDAVFAAWRELRDDEKPVPVKYCDHENYQGRPCEDCGAGFYPCDHGGVHGSDYCAACEQE